MNNRIARPHNGTSIEPHLGRRLADVERDLILGTLLRCGGNRTFAADILGISAAMLRERLIGYARNGEAIVVDKARLAEEHARDGHSAILKAYDPGRTLPS